MASLPGYLCIGGDEIVNNCRTLAYIRAGLAPAWSAYAASCDCCCANVDEGNYTTPAGAGFEGLLVTDATDILTTDAGDHLAYSIGGNAAPWYDPSRPESGEFLGILVRDFHSSIPLRTPSGGVGRSCVIPVPRTLTLDGTLVSSTCRGTEYGKEWLARALNNACLASACCPTRGGIIERWCGEDEHDDSGERSMTDVRMVSLDFPETSPQLPCCEGADFTFIIEADPFLYGPSSGCVLDEPWNLDPEDAQCIDWCANCPEPPPIPSDPSDPCAPQAPIVPPPVSLPSCWCEPLATARQCCNVSGLPQWSDSVMRITIWSGSEPLRNATVRVWPDSPTGTDPATPEGMTDFHCFPECALAEISLVPAFSTLVIDGVTRTITLTQPGDVTTRAENLVFGPSRTLWTHPALLCGVGNWICMDVDIYNTATDATLSIELIPREIG